MKYASKRALLERIDLEHELLLEVARTIPRRRWREPGVWGEGWNVADLFAHLSEWHRMLLRWIEDGRAGRTPELPAPDYTWRETPRLNRDIQKRFAKRAVARIAKEFDATHATVLGVVHELDEKDLLRPGCFAWTRRSQLASYVGANSASHYAAARKILRRWLREGTRSKRRG